MLSCRWLLLPLLLISAGRAVSVFSADRLPNIVLIYGDDVGYGDISANGSSAVQTPNIDRISADGLRFTDAHSSAATCTPSRFAMLTGQYAFRKKGTGVLAGNANLIIGTEMTTLPGLLKQAGYSTAMIGKWHLGLGRGEVDWNGEIAPGPKQIGFDYHFIIPATGDRVPCVYVEQGRVVDLDPADPIRVSYGQRIDNEPSGAERVDLLKQAWSHGHNQSIVNGISRIGWMTGGKSARWIDEEMADVITHKATTFLDQHRDQPFFLMFATQDIHVPRVPHSRFAGKSGLGLRGDAIMQLDACVGNVLDKLDELKLTENTLVIFTSDNGPVLDDGYVDEANERLGSHDPNGAWRAGKYSRFEGGTRVPLLVRFPLMVKRGTGKFSGKVSDALFGQVDLCHSLAKLAGLSVASDVCIDSRDELDTLLGRDATGRPHLIHEAGELALRMGKFKFVPPGKTRDNLGPWTDAVIEKPGALYDLAHDPTEATDIGAAQPEQLRKMIRQVADIRTHGDR